MNLSSTRQCWKVFRVIYVRCQDIILNRKTTLILGCSCVFTKFFNSPFGKISKTSNGSMSYTDMEPAHLYQLRTYPRQHGLGDSLWATTRTTSCSPSSATAIGTSKTPKVDVQEGGDVIHRLAKEVPFILYILYGCLDVLIMRSKCQERM